MYVCSKASGSCHRLRLRGRPPFPTSVLHVRIRLIVPEAHDSIRSGSEINQFGTMVVGRRRRPKFEGLNENASRLRILVDLNVPNVRQLLNEGGSRGTRRFPSRGRLGIAEKPYERCEYGCRLQDHSALYIGAWEAGDNLYLLFCIALISAVPYN